MNWIEINGDHINLDHLRTFRWQDGKLCLWYAWQLFYAEYDDPDKKLYRKLCDNDLYCESCAIPQSGLKILTKREDDPDE